MLNVNKREINLGLDLKGGMNVTLEVMVVDVVEALSNNSNDSIFNVAISNALRAQNSQDNFVTLFQLEYEKLAPAPNVGLTKLALQLQIYAINQFSSTNQSYKIISVEVEAAIDRSFNILRELIVLELLSLIFKG